MNYELEVWGTEISGSLFFLLWSIPMACSGQCSSGSIERVRMEVRDVQKSSLELSWWLWVTMDRVSLGSLDPGRTFANERRATAEKKTNKQKRAETHS